MYYEPAQWIVFFFIYSLIGWIWEVIYVAYEDGKITNRGFLNGPILPIYGTGAVIILMSTLRFRDNILLVYLLGMISATILEYITGEIMEYIFHARYWDYSDKAFNIKGHIYLLASLLWGIFSILLVRYVHPFIEDIVMMMPYRITEILSILIVVLITIDTTRSVRVAFDLKSILRKDIEELKERIKIEREYRELRKLLERNPYAVSRRFPKKIKEIIEKIKNRDS